MIHDLQAFSPYFTRTLRADVDERRPVRSALTRKVAFTDAQRALYDAVLAAALSRADLLGTPPGFVTQMPERRVASCPPAVAREIVSGGSEPDDDWAGTDSFLRTLAEAVLDEPDPKLTSLVSAIREMQAVGHTTLIVFSTFPATLRYLHEGLTRAGFSVEQMHGGTPQRDEDCKPGERSREAIAAAFRDGEFQVLTASEVASEGLDFQHCAVLVNYDLPWNPMRVEQRIGRIDRIGQEAEKITIINLSTPDTIESRILDRLYLRLGVFERALGEMELILGDELDEFHQDLFSKRLSPEEQEARLDKVARVVEERRRQDSRVEAEHGELLSAVQRVEVQRAEFQRLERRFLGPLDLERFVVATLRQQYGENVVRERAAASDELIFELAPLAAELATLGQELAPTSTARKAVRTLQERARRGEGRLVGTFRDAEYRKGVELIHIRHPLVLLCRRQRRHATSQHLLARGRLSVGPSSPLVGRRVAGWAIVSCHGILSSVALQELVMDEDGNAIELDPDGPRALDLLTDATASDEPVSEATSHLLERVPSLLAERSSARMLERAPRNEAALERARAALRRSTAGRRTWLSQQLGRADLEPKLRRMFESWEARLDQELASKLADLDTRGAFHVSVEFLGAAVLDGFAGSA